MQLNRWQVKEIKHWNGPLFDPKATLQAMRKNAPEKIRKAMVKLNCYHGGQSLEDRLDQYETHYVDSLNDFYYEILSDGRRNVQLIEARYQGNVITSATTGNVGGGSGAIIELLFGEDYFFEGEVIVGEKNEKYPVRIVREPQPEGLGAVRYFVECYNLPNGIPAAELMPGKKFSPEYAPAEAGLSRFQGGIRRSSHAKVMGTLGTIRIDHKVAGDVDDYAVGMGFPVIDKNGKEKVMTVLSHWEDWEVEKEFAGYKDKMLGYGTATVDENGVSNVIGKSGREIKAGLGLMPQIEQTNVIYFNFFSLDLLESMLQHLSYNKLGLNDRNFLLRTGQGGAGLFNKAVLDRISGWQSFLVEADGLGIQRTTSELHTNSLKAGFQFTEYLSPNGIKVKVEVDPSYDDPIRNKILMPGTQIPAMSFRMDIIYQGSKEEPNIQKLGYKKFQKYGGELRGYGSGFRNPFTGNMNVDYMSTDEDSATITKFTHTGVVVYNTELCASLIPNVLQ